MAEKTEKATPKKLRDAKKKGQIAKSQDFPGALTFVASSVIVLVLAQMLYRQLGDFLVSAFRAVSDPDLSHSILKFFYEAIGVIFLASIPVLGTVTFVGILVYFLSIGPVFAPEVFKFDIKKFNPVTNLKAKFKLKTLVELIKSVIKIFLAGYIIYLVMAKSIPVLIHTVSLPISGALLIFSSFLLEVIVKVGLLFLVIATADFIYQKKSFAKEMMMEKFEVKQEYKNTEGDPHIKGKRRQVAQEIAYSEGPIGGLRKAQALITNPTHLAIAIGYEEDVDAAPYILGMGSDHLAAQMIKMAEKYEVPVLRNVPLARKLWDEGELYEYVPEETYEPLAEILRWISFLKEGIDVPKPFEE